jgi:mono/diheme cytochrome c family protein
MSRYHVFVLGVGRAPRRRLLGKLLGGVLALAGSGFVPGCSPAASEQLDTPRLSVAEQIADRGDAETGKQLFGEQCSACHAVTAGPPRLGPDLEGVLRRERLDTGRPATEPVVRELILEGSGAMRAFRESLTDQQLDDLIAYLKTL